MEDKPRLYTTHCRPDTKRKLIGSPVIVNGKPSIAFIKDGRVESYIPWEEAKEIIAREEIPIIKTEF